MSWVFGGRLAASLVQLLLAGTTRRRLFAGQMRDGVDPVEARDDVANGNGRLETLNSYDRSRSPKMDIRAGSWQAATLDTFSTLGRSLRSLLGRIGQDDLRRMRRDACD